MGSDALCFLSAVEMARLLRAKDVSARELLAAHLAQIARVNPRVNALISHSTEQALQDAAAADDVAARGEWLGPLHGLPVAHKDLVETKGVRTTFGSPIYRNYVPQFDALIVERLKRAGAISIGKTNTPEFGAGSHTFNTLFGATLNPWDLTKTCGGSSGGAAVALACGMVAIADGSDLGGSLRNPGNFNNIVGFRPTQGRVPAWPQPRAWGSLSTLGPMARNVTDVALMLSVIAGPDARAPGAQLNDGADFCENLERAWRGTRIAWSADLGGLPVECSVTDVLHATLPVFTALGCHLEVACPDFAGADETFKALRAYAFTSYAPLLATQPDQFKATVAWNIKQGLSLSAVDIGRAEQKRTEIYHRMRAFMTDYEFLICPVNQVTPFPVSTEYPLTVADAPMHTYIDWMKSCYFITVTGHPAISVPAGFTPDGLPVGVQIVGRYGDDLGVLQMAYAFEQATQLGQRRPPAAV